MKSNLETAEAKKRVYKIKIEIYKLQCMASDLKVHSLDLQIAYDRICEFEKELLS